jgi:hypothetical protein
MVFRSSALPEERLRITGTGPLEILRAFTTAEAARPPPRQGNE